MIDGFSFLFITPGQRYFAESGIQPLGSSTRSFCSRKEYWNPRPWRKPSFEHTHCLWEKQNGNTLQGPRGSYLVKNLVDGGEQGGEGRGITWHHDLISRWSCQRARRPQTSSLVRRSEGMLGLGSWPNPAPDRTSISSQGHYHCHTAQSSRFCLSLCPFSYRGKSRAPAQAWITTGTDIQRSTSATSKGRPIGKIATPMG